MALMAGQAQWTLHVNNLIVLCTSSIQISLGLNFSLFLFLSNGIHRELIRISYAFYLFYLNELYLKNKMELKSIQETNYMSIWYTGPKTKNFVFTSIILSDSELNVHLQLFTKNKTYFLWTQYRWLIIRIIEINLNLLLIYVQIEKPVILGIGPAPPATSYYYQNHLKAHYLCHAIHCSLVTSFCVFNST